MFQVFVDVPIKNLRAIIRITLTSYWMLLSELWLTYNRVSGMNALFPIEKIVFTKNRAELSKICVKIANDVLYSRSNMR